MKRFSGAAAGVAQNLAIHALGRSLGIKGQEKRGAQIAALSVMKQHTDFNDPAKINRMTAFLAGGSMTGLLRARTRHPWRAAHI